MRGKRGLPSTKQGDAHYDVSAVVWFTKLDCSIQEGDLENAIRARDELRKLGYEVTKAKPLAGVPR